MFFEFLLFYLIILFINISHCYNNISKVYESVIGL